MTREDVDPSTEDVARVTEDDFQALRARVADTPREPLLPEGAVTGCHACGGVMRTTNDLRKSIPTPQGLLVLARLPGARCERCGTVAFDAAALAIIQEHSASEIVADYETTVTRTSGRTLGTYLKADLARVLKLTGKEHLRWKVIDADHAFVEIQR